MHTVAPCRMLGMFGHITSRSASSSNSAFTSGRVADHEEFAFGSKGSACQKLLNTGVEGASTKVSIRFFLFFNKFPGVPEIQVGG